MAKLQNMPSVALNVPDLARFGQRWLARGGRLSRTPPESSGQWGELFDTAVGAASSIMLGGIPIVRPNGNSLLPPQPDCVEVGPVRIVGGVRPQNFDVGYRPDGVRFAFDSKSLNDADSIRKNWQNMINDLATEATTVHSRFPYAVVAFLVILPAPALAEAQKGPLVETLERLALRNEVNDPPYMAEAISLVLWKPEDGEIVLDAPAVGSHLRLERFSEKVQAAYYTRYKGLPPHAAE